MGLVLWEVDAQADFMLPGGKLYVPGAEKIMANLNRLVEQVRQSRVLLISSADAHQPDECFFTTGEREPDAEPDHDWAPIDVAPVSACTRPSRTTTSRSA